MKKIQIIVDHAHLDSVVDIFTASTTRLFTVTVLKEYGLGKKSLVFRGQPYDQQFELRSSVDAILSAEDAADLIAALRRVEPTIPPLEVSLSPLESVHLHSADVSATLPGAGARTSRREIAIPVGS